MSAPAAAVIAEMQRYAASVGMVLTSRCIRCKAPLWNAKSLHHHLGPICRAKLNTNGDPGSLAKETTGIAVTSNPTL
ncbi:hypothetical protein IWX75_002918 [Arthrobacter sp. CAN_A6]